jgi:rubrerythrin
MPEHVSIEYDHPGKCPICGMVLVPVTAATLEKLKPGGKLLYYTCPMPEHGDVHSEKPGRCPKCGMTLIPIMEEPPLRNALPKQTTPTSDNTSRKLYTCLMADHNIVADKPGKCPECEMDLVPTSTVPHGKAAEAKWTKEHGGKP